MDGMGFYATLGFFLGPKGHFLGLGLGGFSGPSGFMNTTCFFAISFSFKRYSVLLKKRIFNFLLNYLLKASHLAVTMEQILESSANVETGS